MTMNSERPINNIGAL